MLQRDLSGCGSGCEYLAVTPWGDFYPCHQFVGNEDFLMGNVDEGITRTDIRDMNLRIVMFILRKSVRIVSLSFIVVVGVLQIHTISMGILTMHMTSAVTYREKELSVLL